MIAEADTTRSKWQYWLTAGSVALAVALVFLLNVAAVSFLDACPYSFAAPFACNIQLRSGVKSAAFVAVAIQLATSIAAFTLSVAGKKAATALSSSVAAAAFLAALAAVVFLFMTQRL